MALTRFRNNLRFALRKELPSGRSLTPLNRSEQIGNILSWFAYEFKSAAAKIVCDPRFVTVCFTLFSMILAALLFYPTATCDILLKVGGEVFGHINWGYCRFTLWILSEITILGVGLRAFGRFSNRQLMEFQGVI